LLTSDFDFALPAANIAHTPAVPRDAARLLVVGDTLADRQVRDLPAYLRAGDVLVVNDTAVIHAQLTGRRGAASIGVTLDRPAPDGSWHALVRNARRLKPGDMIGFDGLDGFSASVVELQPGGAARLRFDRAGADLDAALAQAGQLALPPYIVRPTGPTAADEQDYQTMFAAHSGAVAAPTAGLHFTPALDAALRDRGVTRVTLTLHVGAGTFLPMRTEVVAEHRMHPERAIFTAEAAATLNAARAAGGRIVAVGTTSLRSLETAVDADGVFHPFAGETDIFITPGRAIRGADLLMTNFHLPRSTLFMLVCAFAGMDRMKSAYAHAIASGYRFYSYGDASLLRRAALSSQP